jgi:hypothetical protein
VIATLFPKYYPRPHEMKTQLSFIKSFRSKLGSVKNLHSNNVLIRKGLLLEVAINKDAFNDILVHVIFTIIWDQKKEYSLCLNATSVYKYLALDNLTFLKGKKG